MVKRKRSGRRQASDERSTAAEPRPARTLSRRQTWLARAALAIGIPAFLLLATEGILRLSGFGYDAHFFARGENSAYVGSNVEFGQRFFPAAIARTPVENLFQHPKPPGVYRIVLLGSSAAIGVPETAFSFARILGAMLDQTYPGTRFEVITAGITATNSHVVLPIARECVEYDPDLCLLYVGNNEVIGPYGIQVSRQGKAPGLGAIRSGIALRRTKIGQLLQRIGERVSGQDAVHEQWRGMETYLDTHIRADDADLERIYTNYRRNLEDICKTVTAAGVDLMVCTVASNLLDSPPFGSLHREDLTDAERGDWDTFYRAGEASLKQGDHATALKQFRRAAAIDDTHADLQFRIGQCQQRQSELAPALAAFQRARELDTLRFRADSRLNDIARQVAREMALRGVKLADCQQAFEANLQSADDIPGRDLFFEHVHFTFEGNYRLAGSIFPEVVGALPAWVLRQGQRDPEPPAIDTVARALAYSSWNEYTMISHVVGMMLKGPPFTGQLDHGEIMAYWEGRLAALRADRSPEQAQQIYDLYVEALRARPGDVLLEIKFITLLNEGGNTRAAQDLLKRLAERLPRSSPLVTSGITDGTM